MRLPEPRLTVRAIRPLVSGLRVLGHDPAPILASVRIEASILGNADAHVPMSAAVEFLHHAAVVTGDSNIGLHLAEHAEPGSFDVHFYAMLSSTTLGAAYAIVCRYQRLVHETTRVKLEIEGAQTRLCHRTPSGIPVPRQSAEFIVAAWVRAGRLVTRTNWSPAEVRFAHAAPVDPGDHARFFGAAVRFGTGENTLILPNGLARLVVRSGDKGRLSVPSFLGLRQAP